MSPNPPPKSGDGQAFDQQLPNDLAAGGSDGGANRKFTRTRCAASSEQIRQIRAGDEQDKRDRAKQQRKILAVISDEILKQRRHHRRLSGVRVGVLLFQARGDRFHFRARLLHRHARF